MVRLPTSGVPRRLVKGFQLRWSKRGRVGPLFWNLLVHVRVSRGTSPSIGSKSLILGAKYGIFLGCGKIVYVRVHGVVEGAGEEFACGVKRGVDVGSDAVWESSLAGYFERCALRGESYGVLVVFFMSFVSSRVKLVVRECFVC